MLSNNRVSHVILELEKKNHLRAERLQPVSGCSTGMLNWTKSNEGDWQRRQQGRKHRTSLGYVGKHQEDHTGTKSNCQNETAFFFPFNYQQGQAGMNITSRTARQRSQKIDQLE